MTTGRQENLSRTMSSGSEQPILCIGAGPACLTAAYLLAKAGRKVVVLESDANYVGGISKTVQYKGFYFDIGGHRFYSKSQEVNQFWKEILEEDLLIRSRSSQILYKNKFYSYPLSLGEAFRNLGLKETVLCTLSYLKASVRPVKNPETFEEWVSNRFGKRLFEIFFKTYTEKVWGISCKELSADWAAQRINELSLWKALWNALGFGKKNKLRTLIDSFHYPRRGPGMMWERTTQKIRALGGDVLLGHRVESLVYSQNAEYPWTIKARNSEGEAITFFAAEVISSAPIRDVMTSIHPEPRSQMAAKKLNYRDFLTVALIIKERDVFSDQWLYINDPTVQVGRVQNFKSWSPEMVPDVALNCYGLEYFCSSEDKIWKMSDKELVSLASRELVSLGLAEAEDILDGSVIRQSKAYPIYDHEYQKHIQLIRAELAEEYPGLHFVGRNGQHRYNNQDHAMMTAMITVENILKGTTKDPWSVNQEAIYHEKES